LQQHVIRQSDAVQALERHIAAKRQHPRAPGEMARRFDGAQRDAASRTRMILHPLLKARGVEGEGKICDHRSSPRRAKVDDRRGRRRRVIQNDQTIRPSPALLDTDLDAHRAGEVRLIDRPGFKFRQHPARGAGMAEFQTALACIRQVIRKCPLFTRRIVENNLQLEHFVAAL